MKKRKAREWFLYPRCTGKTETTKLNRVMWTRAKLVQYKWREADFTHVRAVPRHPMKGRRAMSNNLPKGEVR